MQEAAVREDKEPGEEGWDVPATCKVGAAVVGPE